MGYTESVLGRLLGRGERGTTTEFERFERLVRASTPSEQGLVAPDGQIVFTGEATAGSAVGDWAVKLAAGKGPRPRDDDGVGAFPPPRPPTAEAAPTPPPTPPPPPPLTHETHRSARRKESVRGVKETPRRIKELLDAYVVGQVTAKKAVAVAVADHLAHARRCLEEPALRQEHYHKRNVLLVGPSGCGKTQLLSALAAELSVPFVKADATKFSATGYVGRCVDDVLTALLVAADGDVELAQHGIVYFDEVDKLCAVEGAGVNTTEVQAALLKLVEDTESSEGLSTRHAMFVFSGAFRGAEALSTEALVDFGLLRELVGRISVRCQLNQLTVDELHEILATRSPMSPLWQICREFEAHGIALEARDSALRAWATEAHALNLGARALCTVVDATLCDFKYELPSTGVTHLCVDAGTVADPAAALDRLLASESPPPSPAP